MRLCIFEAGLASEIDEPDYGSYPDMTERWLAKALPEASFHTVSVVSGAPLPEPEAYDGYIVTGSKHGVYDDLPWMAPLSAFLRAARALNKPMFGICFGHQIMAHAFGGTVRKSGKGWGVGVQAYYYPGETPLRDSHVLVFHQDQVEDVPEGASVIGGNAFCPNGVLRYDFPALSAQFHPEFETGYVEALTHILRDDPVPAQIADEALESLGRHAIDSQPMAAYVADFFRTAGQTAAD